jgi:hypothetical protein
LSLVLLFSIFFILAILRRRDAQIHKRCMVLASLSLIEAAVGRWPLAFLRTGHLLPFLSPLDLTVDLFLLPLVWWDLHSCRRLHSVTLWGGLALILIHPLRLMLAGTVAWQRFAAWSVPPPRTVRWHARMRLVVMVNTSITELQPKSGHLDPNYGHFHRELYARVRRDAFGKEIGQNSWLTSREPDRFLPLLRLSRICSLDASSQRSRSPTPNARTSQLFCRKQVCRKFPLNEW